MAAGTTGVPVRRPRRGKRVVPYLLSLPGGLWLLVLFILPMGTMALVSTQSGLPPGPFKQTFDFGNYGEVLRAFHTHLLRSLQYAGIVTILALLICYPMAYWIALYGGKRKNGILLLILLPFFVSFVIRTIQWQFILADQGIILGPLKRIGLLSQNYHVLSTSVAVIGGMTYNFIPFTALPLYVALERIDPRLIEAAGDLYSSKVQAFLRVVLPLSIPGIFAAFLLTFIPAVGDYVNAAILGGPGNYMIGNIIQTLFITNGDYPRAAALGFILMALLLVGAALYAKVLGTEEITV